MESFSVVKPDLLIPKKRKKTVAVYVIFIFNINLL